VATDPQRDYGQPVESGWTYERWLTLPDDGNRYEVVNGLLVKEPPPVSGHQAIVRRLLVTCANHLGHLQEGLFDSPIGVRLSDSRIVQPDLLYVRPERHALIGDTIEGAPDLVCEVLSPSTREFDLGVKRLLYAEEGVQEYWIIDPVSHTVTVHSHPADGDFSRQRTAGTNERIRSDVLDLPLDVSRLFSHIGPNPPG
jgi:Uma2 family endonuclease